MEHQDKDGTFKHWKGSLNGLILSCSKDILINTTSEWFLCFTDLQSVEDAVCQCLTQTSSKVVLRLNLRGRWSLKLELSGWDRAGGLSRLRVGHH